MASAKKPTTNVLTPNESVRKYVNAFPQDGQMIEVGNLQVIHWRVPVWCSAKFMSSVGRDVWAGDGKLPLFVCVEL